MRRNSGKAVAAVLLVCSTALAAQPEAATAPAIDDGPLRINITAVTGIVSARQDESQAWAAVRPGQAFDEGVELRTGPRSVVKFDIPPASSITLDRLGTVKVVRAAIENGTIKTDLGMKYGRARYDIEAAGREHDAKIRSASAVLAIRGTDVILDDTPGFEVRAVSVTGRARYTDASGRTVPLGSPDARFPARIEGEPTAAETGRGESVATSPFDLARTAPELAVIVNIPTAAGLPPPPSGARETQLFLASAAGGGSPTLPPIDTVPPPPPVPPIDLVSGRLEFVLGWTGDADLQIGVISALGEPITTNPSNVSSLPSRATGPAGTSAASGGLAGADSTGGAAGSFVETVTWPNGFPAGTYDYGVKYASGRGPATYTLDVVVNGVKLDPPTGGTLTGPTAGEFDARSVEIQPVDSPTVAAARPTVGKKKRK